MIRGVDTAAVLPLRDSESNQPDAGRLITALRQIGYSLEQAIADLVDNSINARAQNVLIRFLHDGSSIVAIAVADDGAGMSDDELTDAMRFGSSEKGNPGTLGKFGMGMKLASMSYARSMSVFSRADSAAVARRWTIEGISSGWWCDRVQRNTAEAMLDRRWGALDLSTSGTIVLWENIDKLPSHSSGLRYTLSSLDRRLRLHLGLCFHRFLGKGNLRIWLDQAQTDRIGQGLQSEILALDPFGYATSGHPGYPKTMNVHLSGVGPLSMNCHIWPPHNDSPEYKLGRRAATRQGFYFYRNGRLIQTGGWNGLVADETEPHSSLARVAIDLQTDYDDSFGINVQKSNVLVPPVFFEVLSASAPDKTTFEDFRRAAIEVYRGSTSVSRPVSPFPSRGLPQSNIEALAAAYGKGARSSGFAVRWCKLKRNEFFRIDHESQGLLLNSRYRAGWVSDSGIEKVMKLLLALLLRHDFSRTPSKARIRELGMINELLLASVESM